MVSHTRLLRRLNRLSRDITENVEFPNHGGCGFIAAAVARILERAEIPVDIIVQCWDPRASPAEIRDKMVREGYNREKCVDWDSNGLWRSHLAVRFESNGQVYHWDSEGILRSNKGFSKGCGHPTPNYPLGTGLTAHEVDDMNLDKARWNSTFNRKQVPKIHELAQRHLAGIGSSAVH